MNKRNVKKKQVIKYECSNISKEDMIEIQTEAYYRALKKIENEKNREKIKKKEKYYKYEEMIFIINVLFWPWKINKRFRVNNQIYDSVLVLFVSVALYIIGFIMWIIGIGGTLYMIYKVVKLDINNIAFNIFPWEFISILLGSTFILAGEEFSKETDSNKIYAYSASILALISCVVCIVALIVGVVK